MSFSTAFELYEQQLTDPNAQELAKMEELLHIVPISPKKKHKSLPKSHENFLLLDEDNQNDFLSQILKQKLLNHQSK